MQEGPWEMAGPGMSEAGTSVPNLVCQRAPAVSASLAATDAQHQHQEVKSLLVRSSLESLLVATKIVDQKQG